MAMRRPDNLDLNLNLNLGATAAANSVLGYGGPRYNTEDFPKLNPANFSRHPSVADSTIRRTGIRISAPGLTFVNSSPQPRGRQPTTR